MACYGFAPANLLLNGEPSQIFGEIVSGNYFDLLGTRAALGRTFRPDEYQTVGTHPVVVLGHSFWLTQLAGDRGIIGREVMLNGTAFTVIGVAPADFKGLNTLNSPAFWVTTASYKQILSGLFLNFFELRRALIFNVVARLKPGVPLTQADAGLKPSPRSWRNFIPTTTRAADSASCRSPSPASIPTSARISCSRARCSFPSPGWCCSSPARTSPISCWPAPRPASARSPSASRSAPTGCA